MQGLSNSLALEVTVSVLHHVLPCHASALGMCQPIYHLYLMFFLFSVVWHMQSGSCWVRYAGRLARDNLLSITDYRCHTSNSLRSFSILALL